jgi:hypothetical protein
MSKFIKTLLLTAILSCGFNPLFAHGSHDKAPMEAQEETIKKIAKKEVSKLVKANKIDKSWLDSSLLDTQRKIFDGHMEWVVSFGNEKIEDIDKKILYVFVTLDGAVSGANYSGQ